jgi:hypothetical protein
MASGRPINADEYDRAETGLLQVADFTEKSPHADDGTQAVRIHDSHTVGARGTSYLCPPSDVFLSKTSFFPIWNFLLHSQALFINRTAAHKRDAVTQYQANTPQH